MIRFSGLMCVALALMTLPALAQRPDGQRGQRGPREAGFGRGGFGGAGFGGGRMMGRRDAWSLLGISAVQEELGLTLDQKSQVEKLLGELGDQRREMFGDLQGFRDLSEDERRQKFEEIRAKSEKMSEEFSPKFKTVLDDIQSQRLDQIQWQLQGPAALLDPEVGKSLGLSNEQKEKIAAAMAPPERDAGDRPERGDNPGSVRERFEQMRQERDAAVMAVLTDAQKKSFEELKGAPFDVSQLRGGFPGGGRRGGDGRGPGRGPGRPERDSNE